MGCGIREKIVKHQPDYSKDAVIYLIDINGFYHLYQEGWEHLPKIRSQIRKIPMRNTNLEYPMRWTSICQIIGVFGISISNLVWTLFIYIFSYLLTGFAESARNLSFVCLTNAMTYSWGRHQYFYSFRAFFLYQILKEHFFRFLIKI